MIPKVGKLLVINWLAKLHKSTSLANFSLCPSDDCTNQEKLAYKLQLRSKLQKR